MTEFLFTYGTLQEEDVQQYIFQRCPEGAEDILLGYRISERKMYGRYLVLQPSDANGAGVSGIAYRISREELQKADVYEGPAYKRILASLQSGRKAWVYVERKAAEIPE